MRKRIIGGLIAAFLAGSVHAVAVIPNGTIGLTPVTGGWVLDGGPSAGTFVGRQFAAATSGGGAIATDTAGYSLGGRSVTVAAQRAITAAEIATAAVAVGTAAYAGCAAGTAIAKWAGLGDGAGNGSRTGCNLTDWLFDEGGPSRPYNQYEVRTVSGQLLGKPYATNQDAACDSLAHAYISSNYANSYHSKIGTCAYRITIVAPNGTTSNAGDLYFSAPLISTTNRCPASIDALDPAFSVPEGSAPGPDGKCPTGRYAPISAERAKQNYTTNAKPAFAPVMADVISQKGGTIPSAASPQVVSITPSSITGDPKITTTTKPDGTVETTTQTPTTTFTPSGPLIKESTTQSTVVNSCVGTGACATTTTTTTTPKATEAAEQTKTDCDKYPDSIGCSKMGTPEDAGKLPSSVVPVAVTPVAISGNGACPADRTFNVGGHSYSVSFTAVCNGTTTYVRPFVLLAGGLLAAWIFVGGFRS